MKKLASRKSLPHEVPLWIDTAKSDYFFTVCCKQRGKNQLTCQDIARELFQTIKYRNETGIWYVHLALIMPDHIHMLISFPESTKRIETIMSKWKEWTAKALHINWQRDFFEHRLRKEESFREKADYILLNPVRAGLIGQGENWPYVFIADPW